MTNRTKSAAVVNKTIGIPLNKEAMAKSEKGTLVTRGFFTSDAPDMHGDIITRAATEGAIEAYRQWGNIRRMHAPDPVGKFLGIGESDGLAWNEVEIEVIDPKAIFEVENELLQALSIGAMIKFEDITWLDDGGMLINAYVLGEISLVDHPANYDAYLNDEKSAATAVEMLVRQYGIDNVSKGMLEILQENEDMTDQIIEEKEIVEDEITETTDEAVAEDVEAEDVETTKEIEAEAEIEDEVVEETVDEEIEAEEIEEDVVIEESIDEETIEETEETPDRLEAIETKLSVLTDLVKTLVEKDVEVVEEIVEEEQDTAEVDDVTEEADIPEDAHKVVVGTEETEDDVEEETTPVKQSLKSVLESRFGIN